MDTYSKKFAPVICDPSPPTDAAFARYMAREVEMARNNLLIAGPHGQTLHSDRVRILARKVTVESIRIDRVEGDTVHATVDVRAAGYVPQVIANISVRTKLDGRWIGQA